MLATRSIALVRIAALSAYLIGTSVAALCHDGCAHGCDPGHASHAHGHGSHECDHEHGHGSPAESSSPEQHDSDNCAACRFLGNLACSTVCEVELAVVGITEPARVHLPPAVLADAPSTTHSRAPPAAV